MRAMPNGARDPDLVDRPSPADVAPVPTARRAHTARPDPVVLAALVGLAAGLSATVHVPPDLARGQRTAPPTVASAPPPRVQDFAYVLNFARRAAERPGVSPYSYEEHRDFLRAWLGPQVRSALCFAYGPAMVLAMAPLFPLSTSWALLAWNLCGAMLAGWAVGRLSERGTPARRWARGTVVGATALHCLVNGQTALITMGGLVAALRPTGERPARTIASALCVALLSAKPPLAIVTIVALLLAGRIRSAALGMLVAGITVLLAMLYWSPSIAPDYAALVGRYNLVDADPLVRAGFNPTGMTNLRSLLLRVPSIDDSQAFFASGWVFAGALALPLVSLLRRGRPWPIDVAASSAIMAYLLFCPHLSPTEDLLLVVPLATLLARESVQGWARRAVVVGCVAPQWLNGAALTVLVPSGAAWGNVVAIVDFVLKASVAAVVARVVVEEAPRSH